MKREKGNAVLEYFVSGQNEPRPRWGFRCRSASGQIVLESIGRFASRAQAEREFVSMLKAVATNQYSVVWITESRSPEKCAWDVPVRARRVRPLIRPRRPRAPGRATFQSPH